MNLDIGLMDLDIGQMDLDVGQMELDIGHMGSYYSSSPKKRGYKVYK